MYVSIVSSIIYLFGNSVVYDIASSLHVSADSQGTISRLESLDRPLNICFDSLNMFRSGI
jgi:hypothetical protein